MHLKKIKHVSTVRDLGGLETLSGDIVKENKIYRSSKLSKIKNKQQIKIKNSLGISKVIDFRTKEEIETFPDVYISNIEYCNYPVLSNFDNPVVKHGNLRKTLNEIMAMEGGSKGYLLSCYRKLVSSKLAINNYRNFIYEIADADEGLIYHCTQGKDRTGVASALLLSILGVSEEDIIDDYISYNKIGRVKRSLIYFGVFLLTFSIKSVREVKNLLIARREYMEEVFKTIKECFKSVDNYILNILKIDKKIIEKIKSKYLSRK